MAEIKTIYLINHTHTDIGYTDYQDTVFRQLLGFIDKAVELGEATADYPPEARFKWTCEVSSFVERYLDQRPASQVDRFLELHRRGQMAVAGMAYHWTPLLSTASMIRSLFPAMRLRRDYCGPTFCPPPASKPSRCPSICIGDGALCPTSTPFGGKVRGAIAC
jgi:alpha-mannosidase